jgi:hypothetical protein
MTDALVGGHQLQRHGAHHKRPLPALGSYTGTGGQEGGHVLGRQAPRQPQSVRHQARPPVPGTQPSRTTETIYDDAGTSLARTRKQQSLDLFTVLFDGAGGKSQEELQL